MWDENIYTKALNDFARACPEMATAEALSWVNRLIEFLWPDMDKVAQTIIEEQVTPRIQEMAEKKAPRFKDTRFTHFSLGTTPPNITGLHVSTTPFGGSKVHMLVDYQSDIRVELMAMKMKLGMKSFSLRGEAVILLRPIMEGMPGKVGGATMYFVNKPSIELDFTGLANVADMVGISGIVRSVIGSILAEKLVLPNAITQLGGLGDMTVYPLMMGPPHPPIGVLVVRLVKAKGLKDGDWNLKPWAEKVEDNYIMFRLGDQKWRAPVVKLGKETLETSFPVLDVMQRLYIDVWDEDQWSADDFLGSAGAYIISEAQALTGKEIEVFDPRGKETNLGVLGIEAQFMVSKRFQLGMTMTLIVMQTQEVIMPQRAEGKIAVRARLKGCTSCKPPDDERTTDFGKALTSPAKEKAVKAVLEDMRERLKSEGIQEKVIERVTATEGLKTTDDVARVALNCNLSFTVPTEELQSAVLEISVLHFVGKKKQEEILGTCQQALGRFVRKPKEQVAEDLEITGQDGMHIRVQASTFVCGLEPSEVPEGGKLDLSARVAATTLNKSADKVVDSGAEDSPGRAQKTPRRWNLFPKSRSTPAPAQGKSPR